ncbi:MAG: adenylate kinase [Pseudoclavibacter sp.]|nr:adenylate kinase [Pseudoclavibacter sp.]
MTRTADNAVRLLIVGPPGAGKGTQASGIAEAFGVPTISTGDIFRANITGGTELGKRVQRIIDAGDLVPDSLTNELVADRLAEPDAAGGFLLDGYPRTLEQLDFLSGLLAEHGARIDAVVQLVVEDEEVVERLRGRALEQGRSDDTEEAIRHRLRVYAAQTAPIVEVYRERGALVEVDGAGGVDEVRERIMSGLAGRGLRV